MVGKLLDLIKAEIRQRNDFMSNIPPVLEDLYLKNLEFFKTQNPKIYEVMTKVTPDNCKIIIEEGDQIDLVYKGRHIYGGNAIRYVEQEVQEFKKINQRQDTRLGFDIPKPGLYAVPRFYQRHVNKTVESMYEAAGELKLETLNKSGQFDFLVVMGIGLGLHISEILDRLDIQNLLILETEFEFIALSCFFTDWEEVYKKQSPKKGKSITIVAVDHSDIEVEHGSLWNELVKRAPHFPFNTVFYNHGRHPKYGEIIRKVSQDQRMYLSLWGYWDDEVSQLNNVIYNLEKTIQPDSKLIPKRNNFKWDKPIIICGSGPSLDARIDQIKSIRNNCVLISAGTSLLPLLKNNILPDFHIEMESDYSVYFSLANIEDKSILKRIHLITGIQSTPYITNMFKSASFFIKDSSASGSVFEEANDKLRDPTPTCVNAAFSFALHYQADEVFLFGTDFGFYRKEDNHSKHSIYNLDNEYTKKINKRNTRNINNSFKSEGYFGDCYTTSIYFTTKRRIEMAIKLRSIHKPIKIYNGSDGLVINGSSRIEPESEITIEIFNNTDTVSRFFENSREINEKLEKKVNNTIRESIKYLCDSLIPPLQKMDNDTRSLSKTCWAISNFVSEGFKQKYGDLNYFIRGSIWHYLLAGYSISLACPKEHQEAVINIWRTRFIDLLNQLPKRLDTVIKRKRGPEDPALRSTIRDELDGFS